MLRLVRGLALAFDLYGLTGRLTAREVVRSRRVFRSCRHTVEQRTPTGASAMMHDFDLGYPRMAAAVSLDGWSMAIKPEGFHGSDRDLLQAVSRGSEAIDVLRHDHATS